MPDLDTLYPGRFLKGRSLAGPTTIQIISVSLVELEGDDDKKGSKAVLTVKMRDPLTGTVGPKEIVWCKTNAALTAAMFGRDYSTWVGKVMTIAFDETVKFGRDVVGGIRVVGSPTLKSEMTVEIKRPRRKVPDRMRLVPTAGTPSARTNSTQTAVEEPKA